MRDAEMELRASISRELFDCSFYELTAIQKNIVECRVLEVEAAGDQRAGKQASAEPIPTIQEVKWDENYVCVAVPAPPPVSALRERKALLWLKENIGPSMDYTQAMKIIEDALRPETPDA